MPNKRYPAIPEPSADPAALYQSVLELKQAVEILTQQRKPYRNSAVTWGDLVTLGIIPESNVPR